MKKTLLSIAVFCFLALTATAQAPQLAKGNYLAGVSSTLALGGSESSDFMSLGFMTTKYKYGSDPAETEYKYTVYNLLPKGGYFIIDNLVAGLEIVISGYTEKDVEEDDTFKESTIGIGPFVRYYYPLEKFYPFAEAEFLFGSCKETWYGDDDKYPFINFGIFVGAAMPLGDKVTFDAAIGYARTQYTWDDVEGGGSDKEIYCGIGIRFGFSIYL
ncbi:MAG: hypothetical protein U5L72_15390 [Bacteroidales bacterium]|nr:hypothetical protein [Bacteroidales bacterium]